MQYLAGLVLISSIIASTLAADCSILPDGIYEPACKTYLQCTGGVASTVQCADNKVFNNVTQACDDMLNVGAPCGTLRDCTGKADGLYADIDWKCRSYYTCNTETFMGHNPCSANLVFNEKLSTCDWIYNVDPPCGDKGKNPVTKSAFGRRR
ncbi:uncharacterized protein LOC134700158 [Mytilus trossulus]|uniref:uncharacterized protein LOC134700158 n=1 Tax=Mytilus trossulus TaxID=6551 RepID=UPI003005E33C